MLTKDPCTWSASLVRGKGGFPVVWDTTHFRPFRQTGNMYVPTPFYQMLSRHSYSLPFSDDAISQFIIFLIRPDLWVSDFKNFHVFKRLFSEFCFGLEAGNKLDLLEDCLNHLDYWDLLVFQVPDPGVICMGDLDAVNVCLLKPDLRIPFLTRYCRNPKPSLDSLSNKDVSLFISILQDAVKLENYTLSGYNYDYMTRLQSAIRCIQLTPDAHRKALDKDASLLSIFRTCKLIFFSFIIWFFINNVRFS